MKWELEKKTRNKPPKQHQQQHNPNQTTFGSLYFRTAKLQYSSIISARSSELFLKPFNRGFESLTDGNLSLLQKLYFLGDKWRVSSPVQSAAGARLISEAEKVVVPEPATQREKISLPLEQTSRGT